MIDIHLARAEPDRLRRSLERKGAGRLFDELLSIDQDWRRLTAEVDELRARSRPRGKPSPEQLTALQAVKDDLHRLEATLDEVSGRRDDLLGEVPNPPLDDVPDGQREDDAVELRRVGEPPSFGFPLRDHSSLGGFDLERGARLSGSRFCYRRGPLALVELAMYRYALEHLVAIGFEPVLPPVLVREEAMYGTGYLPTEEVNLYRIERDDLYLTGTSEVALAAIHQGEILDGDELPLLYAGYSTCFRREAGAAGRDTRGVIRLHQFDKVEMFVFCAPESSKDEHERLLSIEEELVGRLGLAYRVVCSAAGDLGAPAAKKYDIEAYIPSEKRYREITSCSNTTDYQARRLNVRMRKKDRSLAVVHTLNGTAMTARWLVALVETYQDYSGAVAVPEVLWPFGAPRSLARGD